jgi:PAS domain S-box-containing protein
VAGLLIGIALIGLIFVVVPLVRPDIGGVPLGLLLLVLAIVLTAITWGTGPSIVVTLLGIVMLDHIQWYPRLALDLASTAATLQDLFTLVIGAIIGFLAGQNVASQKYARQLLERSEAERKRLDAVLEVLPSGVALADRDGTLVRYNSHFKEIWGQDAPLVSVADYARFQARWPDTGLPVSSDQWALSRVLRHGEVVPGEEVEIIDFTGQHKTILNAAAPIRDAQGVVSGAVVAEMDITERKRREEQVHGALHDFLALAEALIVPMESSQPQDDIVAAPESLAISRFAELILDIFACQSAHVWTVEPASDRYTLVAAVGLSSEEERRLKEALQGVSIHELFTAEQYAALESGSSIVVNPSLSARYARARDSEMPSELRAILAPLRWEGHLNGLLGLSYLEDQVPYGQETPTLVKASARLAELILERERIMAQREEARASAMALEEAAKQIDAFIAMATHELKTPLTAILLALQLSRRRMDGLRRQIADQAPEAGERLTQMIENILMVESQGRKLDRLVNDMLDLSRFQAGKLQVRPELTDLWPLVLRAVEEQHAVAPTRTIQLHLPDADQPIIVQADPDRIVQVIENYLSNASKYSPDDRPVDVGIAVNASTARVWVQDQGPGLSAAEHERLWQRFYRVPGIEVQSGSGIGLGLGLTIVRQIVELHGGEVGVESVPGQGSTFWFNLPLVNTSAAK